MISNSWAIIHARQIASVLPPGVLIRCYSVATGNMEADGDTSFLAALDLLVQLMMLAFDGRARQRRERGRSRDNNKQDLSAFRIRIAGNDSSSRLAMERCYIN
ncbi:Os02g0613750 [Oryza sativa Japonica Group]|uniref:Os02g0613750 protein n=2 Tax=Oryza sativa subsp. japonica TaxID=39947 RepID=Q6K5Z2_ORYSJ|nr:hypothetical protein [Oryza sativa Japonica Group]BAS79741.1 Os02g0613750 [Oryza sativa Japonica Group]